MLEVQSITFPEGITLQCGEEIAPLEVAYQTYGTLSPRRDNAIVICHAFTGDQFVASPHPVTGKPGWWSRMVGPGLPIDTDRFFVICTNVLGGCMGTTGPTTVRADTGRPWGKDFPPITMHDIVAAQLKLIEHFGIDRLFAVIGGSMGGMQTLTWATDHPDRVFAAMPIATSPFQSAQNIAFNEVSRQAIYADPDWHGGDYQAHGVIPARGLAVARMVGHITYLSEEALTRKFGREIRPGTMPGPNDPLAALPFGGMFQVESYLRYQGSNFTRRFDAHSYLSISRAMDFFDLGSEHEGSLSAAFRGVKTRFCVVSFSSDWLFPTSRSRTLVRAINQAGGHVSFVEIDSDRGHDAFLLEEPDFDRTIRGFLNGMASNAGLPEGEPVHAV